MTRTAEQQAAYDRMVGTAQTVRDQMDAGVIPDDRTAATVTYPDVTAAGVRDAQAADRVTDATIAISEYAESNRSLATDEYVDMRRARFDALDQRDATYAAYCAAKRIALGIHRTLKGGDEITLRSGITGTVRSVGTLAGWVVLGTGRRESVERFDYREVASVTRN